MHTPKSLADIAAILSRTEPADTSALDMMPPARARGALHVGEAPLSLQHLWNTYVHLQSLVAHRTADEHTHRMYDLVADLVILGLRDVYSGNINEHDTFFITLGWHVYILKAQPKGTKLQVSVH